MPALQIFVSSCQKAPTAPSFYHSCSGRFQSKVTPVSCDSKEMQLQLSGMKVQSLGVFFLLVLVPHSLEQTVTEPASLQVFQEPANNGSVGSPLDRQPVIIVRTAKGEVATANLVGNIYVTASLKQADPPGVLVGTERVLAECGIATFTDLRVDTMGEHEFNFRALVGAFSVTASSFTFFLTHGAAHHLSVLFQPSGSQAQQPLSQEPVVQLLDSLDNLVVSGPDSVLPISAWVLSGTPIDSRFSTPSLFPANVSTYPSVEGVCKLSPISIDSESQDVVLLFSAPNVIPVASAPFPTAGPPSSLNFSSSPPSSAGALEPLSPQPAIALRASSGVLASFVPLDQVAYVLVATLLPALSGGTGALLLGTKSVELINGTAIYTDLRINVEGLAYRLRFQLVNSVGQPVASIPVLESGNLTVQVGAPHALSLLRPASGPSPTFPLSQQPIITVVDLAGNLVPTSAVSVTATLLVSGSPDAREDNLGGTREVPTFEGRATFATLSVRTVGSDYSLLFTSTPPLEPVLSLPVFEVSHGALDHVFIAVQPRGGSEVGELSDQPRLEMRDRGDNLVEAASGTSVTARLHLPSGADAASYNVSIKGADGVGWLPAEETRVLAQGGIVAYVGLRVFGPASDGVSLSFEACEGLGGVGGCVAAVRSERFALAGRVDRLQVLTGAAADPWGTVGASEWFFQASAEAVDGNGLPVTFEGLAVENGGVMAVEVGVGLCHCTDRTNWVFHCDGEEGREGGREGWREGELGLGELGWEFCRERGGDNLQGRLEGGTTAAARGGVAVFSGGLRVNQTGLYKLRFRAYGLALGDSSPFEVVVGAVHRLEVLREPEGMEPGQRARIHPVVGVVDVGGNVVEGGCSAEAGAAGMEVWLVANASGSALLGGPAEELLEELQELPGCIGEWVGLRVDLAGQGMRLWFAATGAGMSGALPVLSKAFSVAVGELAAIREMEAPSGCIAGRRCEANAAVLLLDAGGNRLLAARQVLARLTEAASGSRMPAQTPAEFSNTTDNGVAVFDGLRFDERMQGVVLEYESAPSLVTARSSVFDVTGVGTQLSILSQPLDGSPGNQIRVQPRLAIVDSSGWLVNARAGLPGVNVSVAAEDTSGDSVHMLGHRTAGVDSDGVVVFTDLRVDGSGYCNRLRFGVSLPDGSLVGGSFSVLSGPFNVLIGRAAQLEVRREPGMATAGAAFAVQPQVGVLDAGGNVVVGDTGVGVTAQLVNGRSDLLQGGAGKIKSTLEGVAEYTNLRLDISGACWVISFVRPGIQSAFTQPLPVLSAVPVSIHLTQEPGGAAPAAALTSQPALELRDVYGNVALGGSQELTVELRSAADGSLGSGNGVLRGSTSVVLAEGEGRLAQVAFTNLGVDKAGSGFRLRFVSAGLAFAESAEEFSVSPGKAAALTFLVQPEGFRNSFVFPVQPVLGFLDGGQNLVSPPAASRTVSVVFDALTMELHGNTDATYAAGLLGYEPGAVGFTDLVIDTGTASTERQVRLVFTAPELRSLTFGWFDVGGIPLSLLLRTEPVGGTAGDLLQRQPVLELVDFSGVGVWWWEGTEKPEVNVTVTATGGQDGRSAQLLGTTRVEYESGRVVFTDLRIREASTSVGFSLHFAAVGLTASAQGIVVLPRDPTQLVLIRQPLGGVAAQALRGDIRIDLRDEFDNRAEAIHGWIVTAHPDFSEFDASSVMPGDLSLVGQQDVAVQSGIAEFNHTGLGFSVAGVGMRLRFNVTSGSGDTWARVADVTSMQFNVSQGEAAMLRVLTSPLVFTTLREISPQPVVKLEDLGGNAVSAANSSVTASLLSSSGTVVTLGEQKPVDGIVTFEQLVAPSTFQDVRMLYSCAFCGTGGSDLSVQGPLVDIASQGGTSSVTLLTSPPAVALGGAPFDVQPVLETLDSGGRRVTADSSTVVTATLLTNEFPSTLWIPQPGFLRGATTAKAERGVVTFTDLAVSKCNDNAGSSCSQQALYLRFYSPFFQPTCARTTSEPPCVGADSPELTISPGPPAAVAITTQPAGNTAGVTLSRQPRVGVVDAGNNLLELDQPTEVTASLVASGATELPADRSAFLDGSTIVTVLGRGSNLDSSFSDLAVQVASTAVAIRFEALALSPADSNTLLLLSGEPHHLYIAAHPLTGAAAARVEPQPVVEIHDVGGNLVTSTLPGLSVSVTIRGGGETSGAEAAVVNGVAAFSSFAVMEAQDCIDLDFQTCETVLQCPTPLPAVSTSSLSVSRGLAYQLQLLEQPAGALPGSVLGTQPFVGVVDLGSNVVVTAQETLAVETRCVGECQYFAPHVDVDLSPVPSPVTEASPPRNLGSSLFASSLGLAPLADVRIDRAGGPFVLHFFRVAGGFQPATSEPFFVPLGSPYRLLLTQQPRALSPGLSFADTPEVVVVDRGGNVMTDQERFITVQLLQHARPAEHFQCLPVNQTRCEPMQSLVGPWITRRSFQGAVAFPDLQILRQGAGYSLRFCDGSCDDAIDPVLGTRLLPVVSNPAFDLQPGEPYQVALLLPAGGCITNRSCLQQPVAELQDRGGNPMLNDSVSNILMTIQDVRYNSTLMIAADPIDELTPVVSLGRAYFRSVFFTFAAPSVRIAYHSTVISSAFQTDLVISDPPAALNWAVAPPLDAVIGKLLDPQPLVEVRDRRGEIVLADSLTLVTAELRTADGSRAQLLGQWKDVRCCTGRCQFTDLALGHVGAGLQLTLSSPGGELWGEATVPAPILSGSIASTGCFAPISCTGFGECRADDSCACQRFRFGRMCEVGLTPVAAAEMEVSPGEESSRLEARGSEGLVFVGAAWQGGGGGAAMEVSMDLYTALQLPQRWLPLESDAFSPAGSVADLRPEGVQFAEAVELSLAFTRGEEEGFRLWVYTFNWTALAWERYEEGPVTVDVGAGVVRVRLSHFSLWGVMLEPDTTVATPPPTPPPEGAEVLAGRGGSRRENLTGLYVVAVLVTVGVLVGMGWHQVLQHRSSTGKVLEAEKERALREEEVKEEMLAIAMEEEEKRRKREEGEGEGGSGAKKPSVIEQDVIVTSFVEEREGGEKHAWEDEVGEGGAEGDAERARRQAAKRERQAQRAADNGGREESKEERKARRARMREEKQRALARKLATQTVVEQGWGGWKARQTQEYAASVPPREPAQLQSEPVFHSLEEAPEEV